VTVARIAPADRGVAPGEEEEGESAENGENDNREYDRSSSTSSHGGCSFLIAAQREGDCREILPRFES
jgi:hypothetical protein